MAKPPTNTNDANPSVRIKATHPLHHRMITGRLASKNSALRRNCTGMITLICRRVMLSGLKALFLEGVGGERAGTRAQPTRKDVRGRGTAGVPTDGAFVYGYPGFVGGTLNRRTR
jgi:hypothetical protein